MDSVKVSKFDPKRENESDEKKLNSSSSSSSSTSCVSKRKNDSDSDSNSNSNSNSAHSDKDQSKKLKIPIKLAAGKFTSSSNADTKKSTSGNEDEPKANSSTGKPGVKLPTGLPASSTKSIAVVKNVSDKVAQVFGSDDDDETEEMPFEAKMKMRNIGRNTPTSTGPNSYGKNNLGFCDYRKLFEKQLKEKADELSKDDQPITKK